MEKEFVPYELAVKLKALGFDEPCFVYYKASNDNKPAYPNHGITQNSLCSNGITAPTFSQAFRWFRKKYKLVGLIEVGTQEYSFLIFDEVTDSKKITSSMNGTPEEAELACLTKLIEIVEKIKEDDEMRSADIVGY